MTPLWGLLAVFDDADALLAATRRAHAEGFRHFDAFSPFPIEGLAEAMEIKHTGVPPLCWAAGLVGAASGFFLLSWNTSITFALNSGGRPLFSWPAYVPITFELMVLFAGVTTFASVIALNRLPKYYHPVFMIDEFQKRNSTDGFFLVLEARDPTFQAERSAGLLRELGAVRTYEVRDE